MSYIIGGLQKLTLLDFPGRVACTVFMSGCNLRCPFCHNAPLVLSDASLTSEDELLAFLSSRRGRLDGVCVSGGEPLLSPDIGTLLGKIKSLGFEIKLDTNGTLPQRLRELVGDGLVDYVAMDLKAAPENYAAVTGVPDVNVDAVCKSADFLRGSTLPFEFRTTVVGGLHTLSDIEGIGKRFGGEYNYFLQNYVKPELPVGECSQFVPFDENALKSLLECTKRYFPKALIRGE